MDVPTRWNLTYLMLERFLFYLAAFGNLARADKAFQSYVPEDDDIPWIKKVFLYESHVLT